MTKLNIVLYEPEIPQNTGNIMRTCAGTGAKLHLIKPLGFSLDEKYIAKTENKNPNKIIKIEYVAIINTEQSSPIIPDNKDNIGISILDIFSCFVISRGSTFTFIVLYFKTFSCSEKLNPHSSQISISSATSFPQRTHFFISGTSPLF